MKRDTRYGDEFGEALERFIQWADRLEVSASDAFDRAADIFADDHFGVESVSHESGNAIQYLNTGDTYSITLAIVNDSELIVTTWGDWYESEDSKYCEQNDSIRCGYCGLFTPNNRDDWSDVTCESCNRNVQTGE